MAASFVLHALGASRVGVCWVQKISNLILNINLRVEDAQGGAMLLALRRYARQHGPFMAARGQSARRSAGKRCFGDAVIEVNSGISPDGMHCQHNAYWAKLNNRE